VTQAARSTDDAEAKLFDALEWRCIGPHRGGRVVAVAGDPVNPAVAYFGACAGGVWKTYDAGTYWENVSDGFFDTASVGAIAVADSDANVVYAGMGEACIRLDVTHGDGVYRSTDAGKTWRNMGLKDTRHISRVRIDPRDPDVVFVAALGHAFGPNQQRGIFRSKDGGENWEHVLFKSQDAGAADLSIDPNNPRLMFASIWQTRRNFWNLSSGGPDSGLWRSTDGGNTWEDISGNPGLPKGPMGRIGVAVSPAKSGRVWATVEAKDCGLYRSDDGGDTWEVVSDDRDLQGRPWYYQHVFADPQDENTVWILNYQTWKSVDGGKTFTQVSTPHGDNHDLWIDPNNPQRMVEGNDGGACVSFNGGDTWSTIYNQPTAQFYHVTADNQFPYRLYGTQQDNSAISVPSRSHKGAIPYADCYTVGSSESGYIAVHPDDPNIVISGAVGSSPGGGGNMLRYDHKTGQIRIITVWPELNVGYGAVEMKYRFQWTYPIMFSPHDPNDLYVTGNVVFRSRDQGSSWEAISPDLTRNDPTKLQPSGGPVTLDTSGAETYCTIFAFVESIHEKGVFWAGSDDGLVHISRDGGETWTEVTPPGVEPWTLISMIEASPHDPATAYIAATRYKLDDNRPMLYKTNDYGASWNEISGDLPESDFTRCIREDPGQRGLLFAGTETGIYVSSDDGGSWRSLRVNLPVAPVYDIIVKDDDLVAATHGRSFWIMDDLTQLRQLTGDVASQSVRLLKPGPAYRLAPTSGRGKPSTYKNYQLGLGAVATYTESSDVTGQTVRKLLDSGQNPPGGVRIHYWLAEQPDGDITLSFLDKDGAEIKAFTSAEPESESDDGPPEAHLTKTAGLNRFDWNIRYADAHKVPGDKTTTGALTGPKAPPGTYSVRLTVGDQSQTEEFELVKHPLVEATQEDLDAQFDMLMTLRDKLSETHDNVNRLRSVRDQVTEWSKRAAGATTSDTVSQSAEALNKKLSDIEAVLIQTDYKGARDRLTLPVTLNGKLAGLIPVVAVGDFAPPQQTYEVFRVFGERLDAQFQALEQVIDEDVAQFDTLVHELEVPAIVPRTAE
tara:strand:- start:13922 stop:17113 length:3192 start_codon:yes stop_codon:yes gene_type:complete